MKIAANKFWALILFTMFSMGVQAAGRNVTEYNLQNGVGLKGYDPVAVFPEGGAKVLKGKAEHRVVYEGVTYFFATQVNAESFEANPAKYEPTYGGNCAWAMAHGDKVDIIPTLYTLNGNRAHYFVSGRAKRNFDAKIPKYEGQADGHWKNISGEEPRL